MNLKQQVHFKILRAVERNPEISQRELARELGVSHGKVHYLLAALIEKGLIKMGNFNLADEKIGKVTYLLTPLGIKNRMTLTCGYLMRKEVEYEALWHEINALRIEELCGQLDMAMPIKDFN